MGSYVSGSLQKFKFCEFSSDSDTHVFLSVMHLQTLNMYDVVDSTDASITSNLETYFLSMMYIVAESLHFICFRIYASYLGLHCYFMYSQLNYLGQTVSTPLKKKQLGPWILLKQV